MGEPASRQIARKLQEDIAFRVLAANTTPDFRTIRVVSSSKCNG
jgi:transposase